MCKLVLFGRHNFLGRAELGKNYFLISQKCPDVGYIQEILIFKFHSASLLGSCWVAVGVGLLGADWRPGGPGHEQ